MSQSSHRINFLVQASECLAQEPSNSKVCQFYGQVMTTVAEKSSTKMDYTIKRRFCKKCRVPLHPGISCRYRIRKKKSKKGHPTQVLICQECGTKHCLLMKTGHKLKCETKGKMQTLRGSKQANPVTLSQTNLPTTPAAGTA